MTKRYCLTQCSMPMLDVLIGAGMRAGWRYEEAVGCSDLLVVGDMSGESAKIRRARALGVRIVTVANILPKIFEEECSS